MARILWKNSDNEVKSFRITARETIIGRDPGCQIVIDDERVSRRHCSILKVEKSFILQDLGSRNDRDGRFAFHLRTRTSARP